MFCADWRAAWTDKLTESPLCVNHKRLALAVWKDPAKKEQLRAALESRLQELQADLNEFIRKHDWNHRGEPLGEERYAVQRTIGILTGLEKAFPRAETR
jgi:hypothetical protein